MVARPKKYYHEVSTDDQTVKKFGKNVSDVFDNYFDKYHFVRFLGQGSYGEVFLAKQTSDQKLVVMKFIKSKIIPREDLAALAKVWGKIRHPNVVSLLDSFHSSRGFCFVTEYAPQGNLSDLLKKDGPLSTEKIQKYTVQLLQALDYLHYINIFHGSLKPQNILIFAGDDMKICDFGLVQIIWKTNKDLQQINGTLSYMSPDMLSSKIFSGSTDLWSIGIVLYELLDGWLIPKDFHTLSASFVTAWHYRDFHGNKPLFRGLSESHSDLEKLVIRLLHKNPNDRRLEWPDSIEGAYDSARPEGFQLQDNMDAKFEIALCSLNSHHRHRWFRDEDIHVLKKSLDTISNVVDADDFASTSVLYESFKALQDYTVHLFGVYKYNQDESGKQRLMVVMADCQLVVKKILIKLWSMYGDPTNDWIRIVDIFRQVAVGCQGNAELARIECESSACFRIILSRVAQDAPQEMLLAYAKQESVFKMLSSCFKSISIRFADYCKASNRIWALLIVQSLFELNMEEEECKQIVHGVTKAFLSDKQVLYVFKMCLLHESEDAGISVIRIIIRCCMYDKSVSDVLCYLPSPPRGTEVVSGGGGGDGTIISSVFSLLSFYSMDNPKRALRVDYKSVYLVTFISDLCLVLATIAQSLYYLGRTSAKSMLTSSRKVQRTRLSILDRLPGISSSLTPSVRLAVASILSLESSSTSSISKIVLPLIPKCTTLCDNLRAVLTDDGTESKLSTLMDGTVGLLVVRLRWDRDSTIQEFCDGGVLESLIDLVGGNIHSSDNQIGLSPIGVSWILKLLIHCLGDCCATMLKLSCTNKYIEFMSGLISDEHLKRIKCWGGPGGREAGVRRIVNDVTGILESPLDGLKHACGNGKKRDGILKNIMQMYIQSLLEVGIPGQVVKCLKDVELEDAATPVSFLARMTNHPSVVLQVLDKNFLNPVTMKRLLGTSSPTEVKLNILTIVSDIANKDKAYYEHIERAYILPFLRKCLIDEDPKLRMQVCETIRHMCRHSDYFYDLLEKHKIAPLLVACYSDQDTEISFVAGTAIAIAAIHNELLHKDLGRCIPQLAKFLFSAKKDHKTKKSACYLLGALVRDSGKLCKDIIFEGAMEALIMLVGNCLLHPCNQPEDEEQSLLDISLKTLENLCGYSYCGDYFHSSAHYPVIEQAYREAATKSKVAVSVSHIFKSKVRFATGV